MGEGEDQGRRKGKRRQPVAVGILNEPTFVGKSRIIHRFLESRSCTPSGSGAPASAAKMTTSGTETERDTRTATAAGRTRPTLSFLIGTDTLTRFFEPKFYPSGMDNALHSFFAKSSPDVAPPASRMDGNVDVNVNGNGAGGSDNSKKGGDGSILISARRGTSSTDRSLERSVLSTPVASKWALEGRVRLLGDGSEGWEEISSTKVREAVRGGDWEGAKGLVGGSVVEYIQREGLYRD